MRLRLQHETSPETQPWRLGCGRLEPVSGGLQAAEQTWLYVNRLDPGFEAVEVRLDLTGSPDGPVTLNLSEYKFVVGTVGAPGSRLSLGSAVLAATGRRIVAPGERAALTAVRGANRWALLLDGAPLLEAEDPFPGLPVLDVSLDLPQGVVVHDLVVDAEPTTGRRGEPATPPRTACLRNSPSQPGYELSVCIDLIDDLMENAWSARTFREVMGFYRSRGIRRAYFIYHYGYHGGFWQVPGYDLLHPGLHERMRRTYDSVGDFLPAAVRHAHEEGLELHAVLKPFEGGLPFTFPEGSDLARRFGKIPRLGGAMWWCADFLKDHPELRIGRRPAGPEPRPSERVLDRLVLQAESLASSELDPDRLQLWVSTDNGTYRHHEGPRPLRRCEAPTPTIEICGLNLAVPYLALTVEGEPTHRFGNLIRRLVTAYDRAGNAMPMTLSGKVNVPGPDFQSCGFVWDAPGRDDEGEYNYADSFGCLDGGRPLGIALGVDPYLAGALSPSYSAVRAWWMQLVDDCLAAGVDGIDFRIANHNFSIDWSVYGFEEPVVRAFEERHGVNILSENFDREAWRRLRGEPYTDFLRQASARLRRAGRTISTHVNTYMGDPRVDTLMNIHWNWAGWLDEGLVDEITVKRWRLDALCNGIAPRVTAAAREAGLPINYCPYLNALPAGPSGRQVLDFHRREALEGGAERLIMYENAAFMRARDDSALEITKPWLVDALAAACPSRPVT